MHHRQRRQRHLLGIFDRRARAERRALAAEELERRAAIQRILDQSTQLLPTVQPASRAPLLTPGQADRSRRPGQ